MPKMPKAPLRPLEGKHFNCTRYPDCRNVPSREDAEGRAWCSDHATLKVVLHKCGHVDGRTAYAAYEKRFGVYWSRRQGARSVWVVADHITHKRLRADSLAEARETIAEMLGASSNT
jgi:hypothetical protein